MLIILGRVVAALTGDDAVCAPLSAPAGEMAACVFFLVELAHDDDVRVGVWEVLRCVL